MHLIMQCQLQSSKGSCLWLSSLLSLLLGVQRRWGRAGHRQKEGIETSDRQVSIFQVWFWHESRESGLHHKLKRIQDNSRAFWEESTRASIFIRILRPSLGAKQVRGDKIQAESMPHLSFLVCHTSFIVSEEKCPLLAPHRPYSRPGET